MPHNLEIEYNVTLTTKFIFLFLKNLKVYRWKMFFMRLPLKSLYTRENRMMTYLKSLSVRNN